MDTASTSSLQVQSGSRSGTRIPLHIGTFSIGGDATNQIVIPDEEVSRKHANITIDIRGTWITDLGSTFGTFVNGQQIFESLWLKPNDVIQLGRVVKMVFQSSFIGSPAIAPTPPPVKVKKQSRFRNCVLTCGVILLILFCGLFVVGGAGYYFYTTGQLSPRTVLNSVGMGTGEINIANISDSTLYSDLIQLTTDSGEPESYLDLSLRPFEVGGLGSISPGAYELQISFSNEGLTGGGCWLEIKSGDVFQLVAVPEGIAIIKEGENPTNPDEIDYLSTSLCKP